LLCAPVCAHAGHNHLNNLALCGPLRLAIEHQNKILDYLTDLLKPFAVDKRAAAAAILSVIDGAFSIRMLYGNSKQVPILSPAEAVLKSFQSARPRRRR
jgi:hypothetical protein